MIAWLSQMNDLLFGMILVHGVNVPGGLIDLGATSILGKHKAHSNHYGEKSLS